MKFSACGCLLTIVLELCMVYAVKTKKCSIPLDPCRNDDDGCKVIYDFSALDFEDNLLVDLRVGIFSQALYDPHTGAVFLLSPYGENVKVSYFLRDVYKSNSQPQLRLFPDVEMNHLQCTGRMGRGLRHRKPSAGEYFSSFSDKVHFQTCDHSTKPTPTDGTPPTPTGEDDDTTKTPPTRPTPTATFPTRTQPPITNTPSPVTQRPTPQTTNPPLPTQGRSLNSFISIYSGYIDFCQRLWLLERGIWNGIQCSSPAIYIYDIRPRNGEVVGSQLIARIPIPFGHVNDVNGLQNIVVDSKSRECHLATAYISNTYDQRLLVFQLENHLFRSYEDLSFRKETPAVNARAIPLEMGLNPLAVGSLTSKNNRQILYAVDSSSLLHGLPSQGAQSGTLQSSDYKIVGNTGCKRRISTLAHHLALDVHFFGDRHSGALYCASGSNFIYPGNIGKIYSDSSRGLSPKSMHLDSRGHIFMMYSSVDRFERGEIRGEDVRTRIVRCHASVIKGTVCDRRKFRDLTVNQDHEEDVYN